jgi:hypothetical protein
VAVAALSPLCNGVSLTMAMKKLQQALLLLSALDQIIDNLGFCKC